LGIHERTTTAVLNAKLLPIIKRLLTSVRTVLDQKSINAPIMVVKGDGTLVGELKAQEKPIETLLSGPAASIIGAGFLSGVSDAFVLDMGGTTTDIAVINNGIPRIDPEGAMVGGFLTRVEAASINTYGLGGDSHIQMDAARKMKIGPQRVTPLCVAAYHHPYLINELKKVHIAQAYLLRYVQVVDCFMLLNEQSTTVFSELERQVIDVLRDGPHSFFTIVELLGTESNLLNLDRLVNVGAIGRISATPTDLLHASGDYQSWSVEAAQVGVRLMAERFNMQYNEFIESATNRVVDELCYTCVQSLINHEGGAFDLKETVGATFFFNKQLHSRKGGYLACKISPTIPLVGIGAPAQAWLPQVANRIDSELIIPENSEVANAIGSAVGRVMESVKILITPDDNNDGFSLHSAWERKSFAKLAEAVAYGKDFAIKKAREAATADGAKNIEVTLNHEDICAESATGDKDIYIESYIEAIATERPDWEREEITERFFVDTHNRGMTLGE
jgi:N-methylhydantoinase A/oxoprolinase/acetone carboxylase beta subunit